MFPLIQSICKQLTDYIEENHTNVNASKVYIVIKVYYSNILNVDWNVLTQLCSRYTLEVVASCGLGVQAQSFSNEKSPFVTMTENIYSHGSLLKTTAVLFLPIISKLFRIS